MTNTAKVAHAAAAADSTAEMIAGFIESIIAGACDSGAWYLLASRGLSPSKLAPGCRSQRSFFH
jgi:hypothetical protein